MSLPEPRPTRLELRWRMFGAEFRVRLMFWVSTALLGVYYYQNPDLGGVGPFCFWFAAVLVSLLAHETGHVLVARLFGICPRVVLSGLGGQVFGTETLRGWQRLLVALAGPLMNVLLFGALCGIIFQTSLLDRLDVFSRLAIWQLLKINALWAILNVLPLWPLDGGRLAAEAGEALLGKRGRTLALLTSLATTFLLTAAVVVWMYRRDSPLRNRFDPLYPLYLGYFCILVLYCYALWLSAFRALWGEQAPPGTTTGPGQAA
jgi:stage IV sporulation protein FB